MPERHGADEQHGSPGHAGQRMPELALHEQREEQHAGQEYEKREQVPEEEDLPGVREPQPALGRIEGELDDWAVITIAVRVQLVASGGDVLEDDFPVVTLRDFVPGDTEVTVQDDSEEEREADQEPERRACDNTDGRRAPGVRGHVVNGERRGSISPAILPSCPREGAA